MINKEQFKRDYPWTYKAIMSGDKNAIIEQVGLIYSQKDRELEMKIKKKGRIQIIINPETFDNPERDE